MGWLCDLDGHEGFLVALVPHDLPRERAGDCSLANRYGISESGLYREVRYPEAHAVRGIRKICIACDCGWRSPYLDVPISVEAEYAPCSLFLRGAHAEGIEDYCGDLWQAHAHNAISADALRQATLKLIRGEKP